MRRIWAVIGCLMFVAGAVYPVWLSWQQPSLTDRELWIEHPWELAMSLVIMFTGFAIARGTEMRRGDGWFHTLTEVVALLVLLLFFPFGLFLAACSRLEYAWIAYWSRRYG